MVQPFFLGQQSHDPGGHGLTIAQCHQIPFRQIPVRVIHFHFPNPLGQTPQLRASEGLPGGVSQMGS